MSDSHELEENAPDYILGLFKWHQNHHKSKKPKETVIYALAEGNQAARRRKTANKEMAEDVVGITETRSGVERVHSIRVLLEKRGFGGDEEN